MVDLISPVPPQAKSKDHQTFPFTWVVDIWRELNPTAKDYIHYSAPHSTLETIDHIFTATLTISFVSKSLIRGSPLPDHSIVVHYIMTPHESDGKFRWHLNECLLSNPVHCTMLDKDIWDYFQVNDNGEVSPETPWAAHKTVIRGKIIHISTKLKHERWADIEKLEREFHKLKKHRCNHTPRSRSLLESSQNFSKFSPDHSSEQKPMVLKCSSTPSKIHNRFRIGCEVNAPTPIFVLS